MAMTLAGVVLQRPGPSVVGAKLCRHSPSFYTAGQMASPGSFCTDGSFCGVLMCV